MSKRKEVRLILACFMIISILGMGFTGAKIQRINAESIAVYANNMEDNDDLMQIKEESSNLISILESKIDIKPVAYTLTIEDEKIGAFKTTEEIGQILEEIAAPFSESRDKNTQIKNVQILENISIQKEEVDLEDIKEKEEVLKYIMTGGEDIKTHTLKEDENFWNLGERYNLSMEELEKMNPDKDGRKLQVGDQIIIRTRKPIVTVITTEEVESIERVDYEVEVKEDPDMYDNEEEIEVEGIKGKNKIITRQIKYNGKIKEEKVINEEVLREVVNQVLVQGSKETPKTVATGSFLMPTRGRISSRYGQRWGRMHQGLDIAKPYGADIKAADGGTVSFSGPKGTYGNMIEIDHRNGYKTRYAHCSELLFTAGQKVAKDQVIAKVGNTGRSTGPHLHFEIIKNGVHQNPSKYVN